MTLTEESGTVFLERMQNLILGNALSCTCELAFVIAALLP